MSLEDLSARLPDYAADIETNLARQLADATLSDQQKWGCFLACAVALGEAHVLNAVSEEASRRLTVDAQVAAKIAAATMAMNTVYFGSANLLANRDYRGEPHQLVMAAQSGVGVDKVDFELWALAVSALTNCETCLNTHDAELRRHGAPMEVVLAALRIAAVVNAASVVLRAEQGPSA
ncbi:Alkyl hydroperoxide reductase AhpD [uncultured Defluviicoccus sp.]|uniref:Alkyl hydroperoxide reductase AhpD n=1 Tax=metagenome TaxID=256318 RepID=A0A380T7E9_9ZZZZ|nr:Alkyl hydroperoxide reductase AhpD [uncultured Defluviicoccus sp.]